MDSSCASTVIISELISFVTSDTFLPRAFSASVFAESLSFLSEFAFSSDAIAVFTSLRSSSAYLTSFLRVSISFVSAAFSVSSVAAASSVFFCEELCSQSKWKACSSPFYILTSKTAHYLKQK